MPKPKNPLGYAAVIGALRAHAKKSDAQTDEDLDALADAFENETDRGAVILLATVFEDKLSDALLKTMKPLNSDEKSRLFNYDAPLGTFSAKIRMSHALGILNKEMFRMAEVIREMRNACAHSRKGISFADPALANAMYLLAQILGYDGLPLRNAKQRRFVFLLFVNYLVVNLYPPKKSGMRTHISDILQAYSNYILPKLRANLREPLEQSSPANPASRKRS
jgi:DNA-binding MltR family transcriptional regulator